MAKKSSVEKNKRREGSWRRRSPAAASASRRSPGTTKACRWRTVSLPRLKLAELPRNSAQIRIRNRCEITGRPRALLPQLGAPYRAARARQQGQIPGVAKSSW